MQQRKSLEVYMSFQERSPGSFFPQWSWALLVSALSIPILVFLVRPGVGVFDWAKEVVYFDFILENLRARRLPLASIEELSSIARYPAAGHSTFFLGNPETFLFSPFLPILPLLGTLQFVKFLVGVHFLIAITGCFYLAQHLKWGRFQLALFATLFLGSPFLIQHIAVGYTPWINICYFPFLLAFLVAPSWRGTIISAIIIAIILVQGGSHPIVWILLYGAIFIALRTILTRHPKPLFLCFLAVTLGGIVASPRILATAFSFSDFSQALLPGYTVKQFVYWALTPPIFDESMSTKWIDFRGVDQNVGIWDAWLYWGLSPIFFAIVLIHSATRILRAERKLIEEQFLPLIAASIIPLALSFQGILSYLVDVIPLGGFLASVEKYPYRFSYMAYVGMALLSTQYYEIWKVELRSRWTKFLSATLLIMLLGGPLVFASYNWAKAASHVPINNYQIEFNQPLSNPFATQEGGQLTAALNKSTLEITNNAPNSSSDTGPELLYISPIPSRDLKWYSIRGVTHEAVITQDDKVGIRFHAPGIVEIAPKGEALLARLYPIYMSLVIALFAFAGFLVIRELMKIEAPP
jgi:hypothetical protein